MAGFLVVVAVKGSARCELAKYSYIHNLKDHLTRLSARIDQSIEAFSPMIPDAGTLTSDIGDPFWVYEPSVMEEMISKLVWDLMQRSGKRWMALFAHCLLKSLDTDPRPYQHGDLRRS